MSYKYNSNQCGSCYWLKDPHDDNVLFNGPDYIKGHCIELRRLYYPDESICTYYRSRDYIGSSCYITTVVCGVLGFADNCEVMETLRTFRKDVLQKDKKYESVLYEYDTVGPEIASKLATEDRGVVVGIFSSFLKPITNLIKAGHQDEAVEKYELMTNSLKEYYAIECYNTITEDYDYTVGGHGVKKLVRNNLVEKNI